MMDQLRHFLLGVAVLAALNSTATYSQSAKSSRANSRVQAAQVQAFQHQQQQHGSLIEEFGFSINDFKVDHQTENNNLNISVSYRYIAHATKSDYPDYRLVAKEIESFLTNYPNEHDYWEIVNKQLTAELMKKYPSLATITCELKVDPVPRSPYVRYSRVTRKR